MNDLRHCTTFVPKVVVMIVQKAEIRRSQKCARAMQGIIQPINQPYWIKFNVVQVYPYVGIVIVIIILEM